MRILITGGSGLIGSAIIRHSLFTGEHFVVVSRNPSVASRKLGAEAMRKTTCIAGLNEIPATDTIDAVINLAGEPIVGKRWSDRQKQALRASRIDLTRALVCWISEQKTPPKVLVSGSAIGYYGNTGNAELDESSPVGKDFAATLCKDWEAEAHCAASQGIRVCMLRTGLVLSGHGGMLEKMRLPFRLGLGSQIGDGSQWMSWIHLDDQVNIINYLLRQEDCQGAFNLTAPNPVTNGQFSTALADSFHRRCRLRAPATMIRLALGEAADLLLGGQKVLPNRLEQRGYRFRYPELQSALTSVV